MTNEQNIPMQMKVMAGVLAALLLAACGGGGSGSSEEPEISAIQTLTGAKPPVEGVTDQITRSRGIVSRADSLILSTGYGETDLAGVPTFTAPSSCSGTTCRLTERTTGIFVTVDRSSFQSVPGNDQAVGTKHDITLVRSTGSYEDTDFRRLGAWMQDSGFAVQMENSSIEGVKVEYRYGLAGVT